MISLKRVFKRLRDSAYNLDVIRNRLHALAVMERERYIGEILASAKYDDPKRLERFGFKVFSQSDEDGILQEIFKRIDHVPRTFVEFGVGNGLENNSLILLLGGWTGLWIEANLESVRQIRSTFAEDIAEGRLSIEQAFITRDNIDELIGQYFKGEIGFLSIDIDGNDIYILEQIDAISPFVISIEYNAKFPPPISIAQKYDAKHRWNGTGYAGASLEAISKVAKKKGYSLVGCSVVGVNAFYVRDDLLRDVFSQPYTAEAHYHPARYFLSQTFVSGHQPYWGKYEDI